MAAARCDSHVGMAAVWIISAQRLVLLLQVLRISYSTTYIKVKVKDAHSQLIYLDCAMGILCEVAKQCYVAYFIGDI